MTLRAELSKELTKVIRELDRLQAQPDASQERLSNELVAVRDFARTKGRSGNWERPAMYFTESDLVREIGIPVETAFVTLDSLRSRGLVTCVNWGGESVWMGTNLLKDEASVND